MDPRPDCGEASHQGHGRLLGNAAIVTDADADADARDIAGWTEKAGRRALLVFHLVKAALPHMAPGSSLIGSSSVNSDMPLPTLARQRRHQGGHR